jgi:hypothetical protein
MRLRQCWQVQLRALQEAGEHYRLVAEEVAHPEAGAEGRRRVVVVHIPVLSNTPKTRVQVSCQAY